MYSLNDILPSILWTSHWGLMVRARLLGILINRSGQNVKLAPPTAVKSVNTKYLVKIVFLVWKCSTNTMKSPLFDTLTHFYDFCKKMCYMSHRGGKSRDPGIQDPFFSQKCLEQKNYASQENFTQPLVVMVETFKYI